MRKLTITPGKLTGEITAPVSKSDAHRLLLCAALGDAPLNITLPNDVQDIEATINCLRALGATVVREGMRTTVSPICTPNESPLLDCKESGSTLRFLLPLAAALTKGASFIGEGRLPERPVGPIIEVLAAHGVQASAAALPITLTGKLQAGDYQIPGNISSQYITGFLYALPLMGKGSSITLTTPLASARYVDMTLKVMAQFGVEIAKEGTSYRVVSDTTYKTPTHVSVEGDWSGAACYLAAGAIGHPVRIAGLEADSLQPDACILDILKQYGAEVTLNEDTISISKGMRRPLELNVDAAPDLFPTLAVLGAAAKGTTVLYNAKRLRIKESDRINAVAEMLTNLGGRVTNMEDALIIHGTGKLTGGTVNSYGDHRIAMAGAIATLLADGPVTIEYPEVVEKSYPAFFEDYMRLGGFVHGI